MHTLEKSMFASAHWERFCYIVINLCTYFKRIFAQVLNAGHTRELLLQHILFGTSVVLPSDVLWIPQVSCIILGPQWRGICAPQWPPLSADSSPHTTVNVWNPAPDPLMAGAWLATIRARSFLLWHALPIEECYQIALFLLVRVTISMALWGLVIGASLWCPYLWRAGGSALDCKTPWVSLKIRQGEHFNNNNNTAVADVNK